MSYKPVTLKVATHGWIFLPFTSSEFNSEVPLLLGRLSSSDINAVCRLNLLIKVALSSKFYIKLKINQYAK